MPSPPYTGRVKDYAHSLCTSGVATIALSMHHGSARHRCTLKGNQTAVCQWEVCDRFILIKPSTVVCSSLPACELERCRLTNLLA